MPTQTATRKKRKASTAPAKVWDLMKTSLTVDRDVYQRAQIFKITSRRKGSVVDLGEIVSTALDEFLVKRGA